MQNKPAAKDDFPAPPPPATIQLKTQEASASEKIICEGCKQPIRYVSELERRLQAKPMWIAKVKAIVIVLNDVDVILLDLAFPEIFHFKHDVGPPWI